MINCTLEYALHDVKHYHSYISQDCSNKMMWKILRLCSIIADYTVQLQNLKKHPISFERSESAHQIPDLSVGDRHFESLGFVSLGGGNHT